MSEHKVNTARYWKREEPDKTFVYFITESNAATAKAEADSHATELTQAEYEANVPEEARARPYDATNGTASALGSKSQSEVIEAYRAACAREMVGVHQKMMDILVKANITHAERIFILEMIKAELTLSMMAPAHIQQQPVTN